MQGENKMKNRLSSLFIINVDAGNYLESFLVSAVVSILAIRFYLFTFNYPQLGGGQIHIAHMLWGGLLMLAALVAYMSFLSKPVYHLAAVVGGIGFGTFIDELGKFITQDNNYFFRPAAAFLYVIFVLLFLLFRSLERRKKLSDEECLVNVLEIAKEAVLSDLDVQEKRQALTLLKKCRVDNPIGETLKSLLQGIDSIPQPPPRIIIRVREFFRGWYLKLIKTSWFWKGVVVFFVLHSVTAIVQALVLIRGIRILVLSVSAAVLLGISFIHARKTRIGSARAVLYFTEAAIIAGAIWWIAPEIQLPALSFWEWGEIFFTVSPAIMVVAGAFRMQQSRLLAFRIFKKAVLILIFLAQFFAFYKSQFLALAGLVSNVVVLMTLNYMILQEETLEKSLSKRKKKKVKTK